jgi:hypothetical protein
MTVPGTICNMRRFKDDSPFMTLTPECLIIHQSQLAEIDPGLAGKRISRDRAIHLELGGDRASNLTLRCEYCHSDGSRGELFLIRLENKTSSASALERLLNEHVANPFCTSMSASIKP